MTSQLCTSNGYPQFTLLALCMFHTDATTTIMAPSRSFPPTTEELAVAEHKSKGKYIEVDWNIVSIAYRYVHIREMQCYLRETKYCFVIYRMP